jgi:hypothetical protein
MRGLLATNGAQSEKPVKFAAIYTGRIFSGGRFARGDWSR